MVTSQQMTRALFEQWSQAPTALPPRLLPAASSLHVCVCSPHGCVCVQDQGKKQHDLERKEDHVRAVSRAASRKQANDEELTAARGRAAAESQKQLLLEHRAAMQAQKAGRMERMARYAEVLPVCLPACLPVVVLCGVVQVAGLTRPAGDNVQGSGAAGSGVPGQARAGEGAAPPAELRRWLWSLRECCCMWVWNGRVLGRHERYTKKWAKLDKAHTQHTQCHVHSTHIKASS